MEKSMLGILLHEYILKEVIQEQSEGRDHRVPKAKILLARHVAMFTETGRPMELSNGIKETRNDYS